MRTICRFQSVFIYSSDKLGFHRRIMQRRLISSDARAVFASAVKSVNPAELIQKSLTVDGNLLRIADRTYDLNGNVHLIGFGKAVFGMACEAERLLRHHLKSGLISVPMNIQETLKEYKLSENSLVRVLEGAENNLPDSKAEEATEEILKLVMGLSEKDILLVLISGGGSALLVKSKPNISLTEKVLTTQLLASAGADITELNTVRKKLSSIKGGKLAQLCYPNQLICLILSDVINDPIDIIASGPTVPNFDSDNAATEIIRKFRLEMKLPRHVLQTIKESNEPAVVPIKSNSFVHVNNTVIGCNKIACQHARDKAIQLGYQVILLSTEVQGLVYDVAKFYAKLAVEICGVLGKKEGAGIYLHELVRSCHFGLAPSVKFDIMNAIQNSKKGICLIAGGEPIVKLNGSGKGGRNQELALLFSQLISESPLLENFEVVFLSAGTDGIDGPTDAAGAIGCAEVISSAQRLKLSVEGHLAKSDSYNFYKSLDNGDYFVKTGHTGTNVMDIHIVMIAEKKSASKL